MTTQTQHPMTHGGEDLDLYCNTIDSIIHDIFREIGTKLSPCEGPVEEGHIDPPQHRSDPIPASIPSEAQRESFLLMRELLREAQNLAGLLRYDVGVTHEDCEYHDEGAQRAVKGSKERIANL